VNLSDRGQRTYAKARGAGWNPADAYRFALADQHLSRAEFNDEIEFGWGLDENFEVEGFSSLPGAEEELREHLADGSWQVESCIARAPDGEHLGSASGVITGVDDGLQHRWVEQSLAWDAGVLPPELKAPFTREVGQAAERDAAPVADPGAAGHEAG
jgi:hypothetical protein